MRRRVLRVLAALFIVAGSGLVVLGGPVDAQTAVESGWWWRANAGRTVDTPAQRVPLPQPAPEPPPPPNVGEGIMVAATPDGASAIAAVRGEGSTLTLTVADGGDTGGQVASLLACKSAGGWVPAAGGKWDEKPTPACNVEQGGASVAGMPSEDGKTWTFAIAALASEGAADVIIVPAANPAAPDAPLAPFQLVFAKPGPEAFGAAETTDAGAGDFAPAESSVASGDSFAADTGGSTSFAGGGSTFSTPSSSSLPSGSFSPAATPALPASEQAPSIGQQQQQPQQMAAAPASKSSNTARGVGIAIVVLGLLAAAMSARSPVPLPRGLARFGQTAPAGDGAEAGAAAPAMAMAVAPTVGGLGRFARPRSGPAPTL